MEFHIWDNFPYIFVTLAQKFPSLWQCKWGYNEKDLFYFLLIMYNRCTCPSWIINSWFQNYYFNIINLFRIRKIHSYHKSPGKYCWLMMNKSSAWQKTLLLLTTNTPGSDYNWEFVLWLTIFNSMLSKIIQFDFDAFPSFFNTPFALRLVIRKLDSICFRVAVMFHNYQWLTFAFVFNCLRGSPF